MYAYTSVKEYANLLRLTSFRGKTLDWIKFETQNKKKMNRRGDTFCVLLGGQKVVMHQAFNENYTVPVDLWDWSLQATSDTDANQVTGC